MSDMMESHLMSNLSPGGHERSYSRDFSYVDSTRSSFSHETYESPSKSSNKESVFQKIIENQRLSFNLAGELKNLRHDLLQSKQDKRILAVQQQSMAEQLSRAEERVEQLQAELNRKIHALDALEKVHKEDSQQFQQLQERHRQLQLSFDSLKHAHAQDQQSASVTQAKYVKLVEEHRKLQEYTGALEIATQEVHRINKTMLEDMEKLKNTHTHRLSHTQESMKQLHEREHVLAETLVSAVRGDGFGGGVVGWDTGGRCHESLEKAVVEARDKLQSYKHDRKTHKQKVQRLLEVVRYYEDMIPLEDHQDY